MVWKRLIFGEMLWDVYPTNPEGRALCLQTAEDLTRLAAEALALGLSAISGATGAGSLSPLRLALPLVIGGFPPAVILHDLEDSLLLSRKRGAALLRDILAARAVLLMQAGAEPETVRTVLAAYFF
ncbi:hypothetical protein LJC32_03585 [Oscillospiraceae bacterium OttesenSCG-928-F05]|nr:hypothetical protein [Oscillospiraceae bacterium OttesenSCG-928-F05]